MELRHLRYFMKVAEELSFSRAAEKLYISQPPLSRQIGELETELKARLFERNNKHVLLTDAGKYFEKEIRQLLAELGQVCLKTGKIAENISGTFRIAYISSTFSADISNLLHYLSEKFPYVSFKLYEIPTAKQIAALELGKLDLGVIRAPLLSEKLRSVTWFRDSFSLVYNHNNLTIKSENDFKKLKGSNFIFFNKDYAPHFHRSLLEICAKYGFVPHVVHECNNVNSIIQLITNGLGVSILPSSIFRNYPDHTISFRKMKKDNLHTDVLLAAPGGEYPEITRVAIEFLQQRRREMSSV